MVLESLVNGGTSNGHNWLRTMECLRRGSLPMLKGLTLDEEIVGDSHWVEMDRKNNI